VLRAARRARGQMHGNAGERRRGVVPADLDLDVAVERRARTPATRVAVVDREECFEGDAIGRQDAPCRTGVTPPASSMLRLRSMPCETTV
jgi:hypothetical protein